MMHLMYVLGALATLQLLLYLYAVHSSVPIRLLRFTSIACIYVKNGVLHSRWLMKRKSMPLANLQKVEYAYHAVVGFVAVWIFTGQSGEEIVVGEYRPGLQRLLKTLEHELPPFSLADKKRQFEDGDVEDTLLLWRKDNSCTPTSTRQG